MVVASSTSNAHGSGRAEVDARRPRLRARSALVTISRERSRLVPRSGHRPMKKHRLLVLVLAVAALVLRAARAEAAVVVVTTTPDLAAIARHVGGGAVEVKSLALATQDPHFVDARPNLALLLNKADLLVVQGLDLEVGWLPVLQTGARNPKIQTGADGYLDASTFVTPLDAPSGTVSRAQGDIHPGGNPHYLQDPRNGAKVGRAIAARLGKIDPANAVGYDERASQLEKDAASLAARLASKAAAIDVAKRKVVVYHRSWSYLQTWLGLTEVGAIEPKPGIPPDPAHIARLLVTMKALGARAILAETYHPQSAPKLLAEKSGAALLVLPGGTGDGERYLDHVQQVAERTLASIAR
ncbi:Zinc ABC transporter, periplasmic-binding protein ZnuA [Minicystis rosea]|nr:Zinc ABC transporter, periplasmic-binding protein ZnuA [Minicystis rosea]